MPRCGSKSNFRAGTGCAFGVVGDFDVVERDYRVRAIQRDQHGVPFGAGFAGASQGLGQGIERASDVVFVFFGVFGLIVDLDFVTVVDWHPGLARLDGNADEDAGIVVVIAHFVDDSDVAVAEFLGGPVQEAHAAVGADQAVFYGVFAGAYVFPAG